MPRANAMWLASPRRTSNTSGWLNRRGSWLAPAHETTTASFLLISTPPRVRSSVAYRSSEAVAVGSYRSISSTADGINDGSPRSAAIWSGCWMSASRPLGMKLAVVSNPAMSNRNAIACSSASLSRSPPSSRTAMSSLSRSSARASPLAATRSAIYLAIQAIASGSRLVGRIGGQEQVRVGGELLAVRDRRAEQHHDGHGGQRCGVLMQDIHPAAGHDRVEQFVRDALHHGA